MNMSNEFSKYLLFRVSSVFKTSRQMHYSKIQGLLDVSLSQKTGKNDNRSIILYFFSQSLFKTSSWCGLEPQGIAFRFFCIYTFKRWTLCENTCECVFIQCERTFTSKFAKHSCVCLLTLFQEDVLIMPRTATIKRNNWCIVSPWSKKMEKWLTKSMGGTNPVSTEQHCHRSQHRF